MRLPGTINLVGNNLPTLEYLEKLKARKQAIKAGQITNDDKKGGAGKQHGDNSGKNNPKGGQKGGKSGGKVNNDKEDEDAKPDDDEWSPLQDKQLIDMKLEEAQWKAIATEVGKQVHQVQARFKIIKPDDFGKRLQEKKQEAKAEKQKQKGGGGGGGDGDGNEKQEEQNQQQGGGKKGKKKNKGQGQAVQTEKKQDDSDSEEEWWEQVDGNWSKDEVRLW